MNEFETKLLEVLERIANSLEAQTTLLDGYLYKLGFKCCNYYYIGSTTNMSKRFLQHKIDLIKNRHTNKNLQGLFNFYGENALNIELIEAYKEVKRGDLYKRENCLIQESPFCINNPAFDTNLLNEFLSNQSPFAIFCDKLQSKDLEWFTKNTAKNSLTPLEIRIRMRFLKNFTQDKVLNTDLFCIWHLLFEDKRFNTPKKFANALRTKFFKEAKYRGFLIWDFS